MGYGMRVRTASSASSTTGFRVPGSGFRDPGPGFNDFAFRAWGFGCAVGDYQSTAGRGVGNTLNPKS